MEETPDKSASPAFILAAEHITSRWDKIPPRIQQELANSAAKMIEAGKDVGTACEHALRYKIQTKANGFEWLLDTGIPKQKMYDFVAMLGDIAIAHLDGKKINEVDRVDQSSLDKKSLDRGKPVAIDIKNSIGEVDKGFFEAIKKTIEDYSTDRVILLNAFSDRGRTDSYIKNKTN